MPLRDHFHPPLDNQRHWEGFFAQWLSAIVQGLSEVLPERYFAEPRFHPFSTRSGAPQDVPSWSAPPPDLVAHGEACGSDFEVCVCDSERQNRLVALIVLVSPECKDAGTGRALLSAACAWQLKQGIALAFVDVVTTRAGNLYDGVWDALGYPTLAPDVHPGALSAVACRIARYEEASQFQAWAYPLSVGNPIPPLPLWLAQDIAVPLDLEASYALTCRALRIR